MSTFLFLLLSLCFFIIPAHAHSKISLRDKIGQMLLIGFDGKKVTAHSPIVQTIIHNNIGGIILFDYDSRTKTYDKNIESPKQVKQLNHDLQHYSRQGNVTYHRAPLPLLISVDYEGGEVNRLGEQYGFPSTLSAADIGKGSIKKAKSNARLMARTLQQAEFNLDFAPVLDVNVNPDNPVIGALNRSFSSDPSIVTDVAGIYSQQFLKHNIQCAYKHFPGHGSSTKDSHLNFVDVTNTWQTYELAPYQELLHAKDACGIVMSAHIVNRQLDESGLPATLSHHILTDILRHQLGFKGVIITDDMQMNAISKHYGLEQAVVLAINAGADMLIFGNNLSVAPQDPKQLIDLIEANVLSGAINSQRIDEAYEHIVSLKQTI